MRGFARLTTVCVLVLSLGLHWALLQTVAWTSMLVRYAQNASLMEAVEKTFDGKHPCPMCKAIQQGRAEEQKHQPQPLNPTLKLDLAVVWQATEFRFASGHQPILSPDWPTLRRPEAPPKPRPRLT